GCPELVSVDDPRTIEDPPGDASAQEQGSCTGTSLLCVERSRAQCNSGCTLAPACRSLVHERCAEHRSATTCDADTSCRWSADACTADLGSTCDLHESEAACIGASATCVWGPACAGERMSCFEIETAAACTANVGCRWIVE